MSQTAKVRNDTAEVILPTAGLSGQLINGAWVKPVSGAMLDIINPCRSSVITTIGVADREDVDAAVAAAKAAFPSWRRLASRTRGALLTELANRVSAHSEEIARILAAETGNALRTQSRPEVMSSIEVLRYYGGTVAEQKGETLSLGPGLFSYTTREPLGVVGAIIPWNSPLVLAAVKIGMALGTGNTLVLKPAEDAPLAVIRVAELAADLFPNGVFNVVTGVGEVAGAALSGHPDVAKISFTGSVEVGKLVAHAAADRIARATLELGGKSPTIVYPDAATDDRIDGLAANIINAMRFARQGQSCTAGSRLYVHQDVFEPVLKKVVEKLAVMKIGDALDEETDIGAIINEERYSAVREFISEAVNSGAEVVTGEVPPAAGRNVGFFPKPTVLKGLTNDWRIVQEEVFGPVLVAIPWTSEVEVIEWANNTHYGLAAYIFANDLTTALNAASRIDAGWLQINRAGGQIPGMSYGGIKQSGIGSEYSIEGALEAYTARKSVTVNL
ncbi:aldehyde dehydrogenase family protein [Agrobacterium tumefaciens]|uniref:aldehyde dehydrogenase family protein n=1 Tax=Agrobacterium tumefaciens TaxID=358 RepID=UPI000DD093A9|nr:aldehyde dehydrogenase family protein [Agrobacterium tumefaciens]MBP2574060.1 acyl-CoA reductase-like NAD-dependent aldehyde dehydrogenase [Agrobacterium tumefaciens]MDP9791276.1 acyl-CoA reductase-like NAD-dependent aldehyde dehydrogenase [Agrobacterium tumefaciens]MDP9858247.1 acyl-CoA reductase-like NAD-dependent aldehyde dehydrogenase [Agrobacterium tumefaciens]